MAYTVLFCSRNY